MVIYQVVKSPKERPHERHVSGESGLMYVKRVIADLVAADLNDCKAFEGYTFSVIVTEVEGG